MSLLVAVPPDTGGPTAGEVADRLAAVRDRIAAVGDPAQVRIVAVTKGFGPDALEAARSAGLTDVGENYAQELIAKSTASEGMRRHFLGPVQRNKLARLVDLVDLWQGIDRAEVIDALAGRRPGAQVLVQAELTGLPGRAGAAPDDVASLVERARRRGLDVLGLMCVGPPDDPDGSRRAFGELARMAGDLGLRQLSMGMTDDFELAVAAGSTMIRLGRVLFGPRPGRPAARR